MLRYAQKLYPVSSRGPCSPPPTGTLLAPPHIPPPHGILFLQIRPPDSISMASHWALAQRPVEQFQVVKRLNNTKPHFPQEYGNNLSKLGIEVSDVAVYRFVLNARAGQPNFCIYFNQKPTQIYFGLTL